MPPTPNRQDPKKEDIGNLSARAVVDLFAPPYVIVDEDLLATSHRKLPDLTSSRRRLRSWTHCTGQAMRFAVMVATGFRSGCSLTARSIM